MRAGGRRCAENNACYSLSGDIVNPSFIVERARRIGSGQPWSARSPALFRKGKLMSTLSVGVSGFLRAGRLTTMDERPTMDDERLTMDDGRWTMDDGRSSIVCRPSSCFCRPPRRACALGAVGLGGEEPMPGLDLSTKKDALRAIDQGIQWLKARQNADGSWPVAAAGGDRLCDARDPSDPARERGKLDASAAQGARIHRLLRAEGRRHLPRSRAAGASRNYNTAASAARAGRLAPGAL